MGSRSFGSPPMTTTLIAPCGCLRQAAGEIASAGISSNAMKRRIAGALPAMGGSASIWICHAKCFSGLKHQGESGEFNESGRTGYDLDSRRASRRGAAGPVSRRGQCLLNNWTRKSRRGAAAGRWFSTAIAGLLLITIVWLVITAPLSRALEPLADPALLLQSDDGHPIAFRGAIKESPVDVTKLNPLTPAAFVAIEDRRFYRHWGIDPRGMGRALVADLRGGGVRQGGSTITQQLAKTSFLSGDRTIKRKAQEVIIAFWLEIWLTKQEILSRYLSSVYFGDGVYGLRAASHHYFHRDPERLSLAQSAMLAGMVQGPSRLAPTQHLEAAQKRSELVLRAMADTGVISAARAQSTVLARPVAQEAKLPAGTYFADWVAPSAAGAFEPSLAGCRFVRRSIARCSASPNAPLGGPLSATPRLRWLRCARTAAWSRWSAARIIRPRPSTGLPRRGASPAPPSNYSSIWPRFAPAGRRTA